MLDIIVFFVELHLSLGEKAFSALVVLDLDLAWWKFGAPSPVHLLHLVLASLGRSLLLCFLLLLDPLLSSLICSALNLS